METPMLNSRSFSFGFNTAISQLLTVPVYLVAGMSLHWDGDSC